MSWNSRADAVNCAICESMVIFERKVRFYEKRHNRKADRALVISPMVDARAMALATELGIEVYSYAEDVTL